MTRDERKKISDAIINLIDTNFQKSKPLIARYNSGTKTQKIKILRDVLNHYVNIDYVPEKAEGLALEKAITLLMGYLDRR